MAMDDVRLVAIALAMGVGLFRAFSYLVRVLVYIFMPGVRFAHFPLALVLPGLILLKWTSF